MRRIVHRTRWRSLAAVLFLVAAGIGCSKDAAAPESPSIEGRWNGSYNFGSVQFEATFTQTGEVVGGTGEVTSPLGSDSFTVTGLVRGQEVVLTLVSSDNRMSGYTARFTGANTIQGRLSPPDIDLKIERER